MARGRAGCRRGTAAVRREHPNRPAAPQQRRDRRVDRRWRGARGRAARLGVRCAPSIVASVRSTGSPPPTNLRSRRHPRCWPCRWRAPSTPMRSSWASTLWLTSSLSSRTRSACDLSRSRSPLTATVGWTSTAGRSSRPPGHGLLVHDPDGGVVAFVGVGEPGVVAVPASARARVATRPRSCAVAGDDHWPGGRTRGLATADPAGTGSGMGRDSRRGT